MLTVEQHYMVLCDILRKNAVNWYQIGSALGFLYGELESIRTRNILTGDVMLCLNDMLYLFLKGDMQIKKERPTLEMLEAALNHCEFRETASQLRVCLQRQEGMN